MEKNVKIDFSSSAIEKSIDLAKSFVDKLIMPAIEETGLLIKSKATEWRFNREISMLNKAIYVCKENNIKPNTIKLKLLCPLLEFSGLEEDEELHDKWAILLSNMVDSEQNIANHVFPYILSQLSKSEFLNLEIVYDEKMVIVKDLTIKKDIYKESLFDLRKPHQDKINRINEKIEKFNNSKKEANNKLFKLEYKKSEVQRELYNIEHTYFLFDYNMSKLAIVPDGTLENFELSNVIRLGLVKEEKDFFANKQSLEIPNDRDDFNRHINIDLEVDVSSEILYKLTELGELFFNACKEKRFK